jgi:DNA-damage-inducible protein J
MANTVTLRAQIDQKLKESAESVLKKLGISTSDAISIFFNSLKVRKGFPPEFKMPNRTTRRAMRDVELGRNLTEWSSKEEFFKALEDL